MTKKRKRTTEVEAAPEPQTNDADDPVEFPGEPDTSYTSAGTYQPDPDPTAGTYKPEKPEKPKPIRKPGVAFKVFQQVSGKKVHQMAGFRSYVLAQKMGPMTVAEWHKAHAVFLKRPVK